MKAKLALIASIATVGIAGSAMADTATGIINQSWISTGGASGNIILPAAASIQSIQVTLASTWCSDLDVFVDAPGGIAADFELMDSEDGSSDLGLVSGSGALANVAPYTFFPGAPGVFGVGLVGVLNVAGDYAPDVWNAGGFAAGTWTLNVTDAVGGDNGAVGEWTITYTIPAPGAIALLGLAGLVGGRRRRA